MPQIFSLAGFAALDEQVSCWL
ncbi:TPA: DUF1456 domain-containing protein, partial [Vibrio mimicus]